MSETSQIYIEPILAAFIIFGWYCIVLALVGTLVTVHRYFVK